MTAFKGYRVSHEFNQTNSATPDKVFPLLCPVRETDWIPAWRYNLIYSDSGVAELGCIFTTPNMPVPGAQSQAPSETTWMTIDYDPAAFRIAYIWITPGRVATELRIQLTPLPAGKTQTYIRFRYTGLSPEGNREVEGFDRVWFESKMQGWEKSINHYLRTGKLIEAAAAK